MLELWGTKIERELASLEWVVTPGGGKYHMHDCNHVKGNGRKYLPCKDCVHGAIRGVIELSRRAIQWCHMSPWSSVHEKISMILQGWHGTKREVAETKFAGPNESCKTWVQRFSINLNKFCTDRTYNNPMFFVIFMHMLRNKMFCLLCPCGVGQCSFVPFVRLKKRDAWWSVCHFAFFFWNTKTDVVRGNVFINFCNAFSWWSPSQRDGPFFRSPVNLWTNPSKSGICNSFVFELDSPIHSSGMNSAAWYVNSSKRLALRHFTHWHLLYFFILIWKWMVTCSSCMNSRYVNSSKRLALRHFTHWHLLYLFSFWFGIGWSHAALAWTLGTWTLPRGLLSDTSLPCMLFELLHGSWSLHWSSFRNLSPCVATF